MWLLEVQQLCKRYGAVRVFENIDLQVDAGEIVAVLGESGVGKSTLLNCIAGLDGVDAGTVRIGGALVTAMSEREQALLRRAQLGFVFQAFHVLPYLSVAHNVALPLLLLGKPDAQRVAQVLDAVGLAGLQARMPRTLSGGQMQRVAIARALVHHPRLVLADEPTGNLDPDSATQVLDLLAAQVRSEGAACVIATHSRLAASRADRVLRLMADAIVLEAAHHEGQAGTTPRPGGGPP